MKNKLASAAKIAANIANSLKSTGPTSDAGKEKVAQNARKHGFTGTRFFCPEHLRPLLTEIETEYRKAIRPQGLLEEDAFLLLRNARFNMERAQLLLATLGDEAESRGVDPLADPDTRKDYLLYQRYYNQAQAAFHRYFGILRKLQSERVLREQALPDERFPGLADAQPTIRLIKEHCRMQRVNEIEARRQATNAIVDFIQGPLPGDHESKPNQSKAA